MRHTDESWWMMSQMSHTKSKEGVTGFNQVQNSFWSCTHVNSCQQYTLYINLHILFIIYIKETTNIQELSKYIKYIKNYKQNNSYYFVSKGATLSKFIHEGIPTSTKPTFVSLPSLTSHSTFYECLRSILCKPQDSPHSVLTRLGVIISYSLHLERKITSPSTSIISPYFYSESSDETTRRLYGAPSNENYINDH